jgi:Ni/Co efflux regulator RcnB
MKSKAIVCAVAAASLGFASLSFAQDYDVRGPRGEVFRAVPPPGHVVVYERVYAPAYAPVYAPAYGPGHRGYDQRYARDDRYFAGHGAQFYRGGRIPNEYRGRQYVVNDWHRRHLYAPQRGQQWVQVGTDYALVAIATGVIAQLVLNN